MDTLALLCNLHADGPETLQLLRRVGLDTLSEIESVESSELASVLSMSADRALRFQREANHLRARLEPQGAAAPIARRTRERSEEIPAPPTSPPAELELPARDVLIPRTVSSAPSLLAPPEPVSATGIPPGTLDGLDAGTSEALLAAGVETVEELAQSLPLELSEHSGLDYTRLLRLQFLARRHTSRAQDPGTVPRPDEHPERGDVAGPFA